MSSSSPRLQPVAQAATFQYVEAELPAGERARDPELVPEERARRREAEAFERGRAEAQQELRVSFEADLARCRQKVVAVLDEFARERASYYHRVEGEVVHLALAIARRILHREVQLDPHALAGIVHVTLEKLDTGTRVDLHVHPREATDWRHYFACRAEGRAAPEIHEDPALPPGECRIETSLGSTEVGLESQLKEIETGLLDLLAERPGVAASASGPSQPPGSTA